MRSKTSIISKFKLGWNKFGRSAGLKYSAAMLAYIKEKDNPVVVTFWDGKSMGTAYTKNTQSTRLTGVHCIYYSELTLSS